MPAPQAQGLGDLAEEVVSHLATSLAIDDTRRPWIRARALPGDKHMFLGIQHRDGRAAWVMRHGEDEAHELRFALSDEGCAAAMLIAAAFHWGKSDYVSLELVHCNRPLMSIKVNWASRGDIMCVTQDGDDYFKIENGGLKKMMVFLKKAI